MVVVVVVVCGAMETGAQVGSMRRKRECSMLTGISVIE